MNKTDFLNELSKKLSALPQAEKEKSLAYYDEIISDRMEDGMSEEQAISALSDIDKIVNDIMHDMSLSTLMKARLNKSKDKASNKSLWLILVIVGSPIWFPLLIAFGAIILSIYIVVWSIILTIYAVELSFVVSFAAGIIAALVLCFTSNPGAGMVMFGCAFILGGLAVLIFKPSIILTKEFVKFTAYIARKTKSLFIKKEEI